MNKKGAEPMNVLGTAVLVLIVIGALTWIFYPRVAEAGEFVGTQLDEAGDFDNDGLKNLIDQCDSIGYGSEKFEIDTSINTPNSGCPVQTSEQVEKFVNSRNSINICGDYYLWDKGSIVEASGSSITELCFVNAGKVLGKSRREIEREPQKADAEYWAKEPAEIVSLLQRSCTPDMPTGQVRQAWC